MSTAKERNNIKENKEEFGKPSVGLTNLSRTMVVLLYLAYAATYLLNQLMGGPAHFLMLAAYGICLPGMFFAAGMDYAAVEQGGTDPKKVYLKRALLYYGFYFMIALVTEVLINRREPLDTINDLLAVLRIPGLTSILLSLAVFYLLLAFIRPKVNRILDKPVALVGVSVIGFLLVLIPEGMIGYGLFGIFIGGDVAGAVPIACHLGTFFLGLFFVRREEPAKPVKKDAVIAVALVLVGAVLFILGVKDGAYILVGTGFALPAFMIIRVLSPIYLKIERAIVSRVIIIVNWLVDYLMRGGHIFSEGRSRKVKIKNAGIFIGIYTLLFAVCAFFIFILYLLENRTLIWYVDGLAQYVPRMHRFIRVMPEILKSIAHGNLNFQQYDFASGMGSELSVSYEPVYWLLLLFGIKHVETGYSVMVIIRYFLAGLSMATMLRFFDKTRLSALTISMVYVFSGYGIYAGTKHGQFLLPMIMMPLLIIGMDRLICQGKWFFFAAVVSLTLLCSYYFFYMCTIALGIYFLVRILCNEKHRNWKVFFGRGLTVVGSYIIAVMIGGLTLITHFGSYVGSARSGEGTSLDKFLTPTRLFYRVEWIYDFMITYLSASYSPGLWLKLGFTPLAMLVVIPLFIRKGKKEQKWLFGLLTLMCMIPYAGFVFSGFVAANNRWTFIYALLVCYVLADNIDRLTELSVLEQALMFGLTVLYGVIIYVEPRVHTDEGFYAFSALAFAMIVLFFINSEKFRIDKKAAKLILAGFAVFTVVINAFLFVDHTGDVERRMDTYVAKGTSLNRMSNTALKYLDQVEGYDPNEYVRSTNSATLGDIRSSSLVLGYNDISTFTSTLASSIVRYNREMQNSNWNFVSIYGYNYRTYLHELAAVKYLGVASDKKSLPFGYKKVFEKKEKKKKYSIFENQYALPVGYTYDKAISDKALEGKNGVEKQEATMKYAIISDEAAKKTKVPVAAAPEFSCKELKIKKTKLRGDITIENGLITVGESGGVLTMYFDGEDNAETYICFDGEISAVKDGKEHFLNTRIKAKKMSYIYKFRIDSYATGQKGYLFNLGYHKKRLKYCKMKFMEPGVLECKDISILSQSMNDYGQKVANLKKESMTNVKTENNTLSGDITVSADKMLVISLPFQNGWEAYVDGKKADIIQTNYEFMGLELAPGSHHIVLRYHIPGLRLALYAMPAGIVFFALIILGTMIYKKRKQK